PPPLRSAPPLSATFPDELLRSAGTAQLAVRFTLAPVEIGGVMIPAGETVMPLLGAGNHDPARFPDPERLDVRRPSLEPLTFGGGVHYCLGAALAPAETEIVFPALGERCGEIELTGDPPRFRDGLTLRGLDSLHVALRPTAGAPVAIALAAPPPVAAPPPAPAVDTGRHVLEVRPRAQADGTDAGWRNAL